MREEGERTTIKDIAAAAGVSKATVSFAFNAPGKISAQTRERVLRIAEEAGYVPDPVARTLATKHIGTMGLLLPQPIEEVFQNPYMFEVLQGIGRLCHAEDLSLTILPPVRGLLSQTVRTAVVDALVTIGIGPDAEILKLIRKRRIPFVTIDGSSAEGVLNVGIDDEEASFVLMRHVLALGHRRIAVIAFRAQSSLGEADDAHRSRTLDLRLAGLERALVAAGKELRSPDISIHSCGASMGAAADVASLLLVDPRPPTVVVCLSDVAALGVYSTCRRLRIAVPEELSVVGFDDIPFAALASPPLTTIRQPGYEKGFAAARLALDLLRGRTCRDVSFPVELVVRASSGPVPRA
jgi:DNA-binding LacI/PurR family transcriptional regulator